ncbi:MAG: class I SAM-dependent methyltransferase [Armatimonadetes bacterium]|nr:class I SAM-dependent methyltransferase [Armatimonadota bacterium]MDW8121854.1 class I SAM-dependent methyltransferase [Armatimonadota bacterium]
MTWYREFFDDLYLRLYHFAEVPERVRKEVDFFVEALGLKGGERILDACCGQGRHSLELARRGFRVVGVDLSEALLYVAQQRAHQEGLTVTFIHRDIRDLDLPDPFDAVLNVFTSFGYLENEEEDARALAQMSRHLQPGGGLILDVMNREWLIRQFQPHDWRTVDEGWVVLEERTFDLLTSRLETRWVIVAADGGRYIRQSSIRVYSAAELRLMMENCRLRVEKAFGDYQGSPYEIDSPRLILIARKEGDG